MKRLCQSPFRFVLIGIADCVPAFDVRNALVSVALKDRLHYPVVLVSV